MRAPGTTAPVESVTVPPIAPVLDVWPKAAIASSKKESRSKPNNDLNESIVNCEGIKPEDRRIEIHLQS